MGLLRNFIKNAQKSIYQCYETVTPIYHSVKDVISISAQIAVEVGAEVVYGAKAVGGVIFKTAQAATKVGAAVVYGAKAVGDGVVATTLAGKAFFTTARVTIFDAQSIGMHAMHDNLEEAVNVRAEARQRVESAHQDFAEACDYFNTMTSDGSYAANQMKDGLMYVATIGYDIGSTAGKGVVFAFEACKNRMSPASDQLAIKFEPAARNLFALALV